MAHQKVTDEQLLAALHQAKGNRASAARRLGIGVRRVMERVSNLKGQGIDVPDSSYDGRTEAQTTRVVAPAEPIEFPTLPSGEVDIEELIERRKKEFARREEFEDSRKLIPIKVKSNEPIAIVLIGDPHVDDPGCDLGALQDDINVIQQTEGMYAACVGDLQNGWVGARLSQMWAKQETTASQAWQLVEWLINSLSGKWMALVHGNHDHWAGHGNPLKWIQKQAGVKVAGDHSVRLELRFPNGQKVRIAARHDWPGQSMWNPTHGQLRAAHLTHHDHIIVSGHRHTGGYQMMRIPATGMIAHLLQLGSYKIHDSYADQLGLPSRNISPSCTVIIDPLSQTEHGLVRVEHSTRTAAEFLAWLRAHRTLD